MSQFFKEIYGVGIIFFYYLKWPIVIGLPFLYFGLDYQSNGIMNLLWVYSLGLIIKDFIYLVVLKKKVLTVHKLRQENNRQHKTKGRRWLLKTSGCMLLRG